MKCCLCPPFVDITIPVAVVVAAKVDAAETVVAASGNEFEVVETVVQLKACAWPDCWDRIVAPHQMKKNE